MQTRELPLGALRAFAVAARSDSLTAAAAELGVTHGAVSKQIGALEEWLGQQMFRRDGRRLTLMPYGQILAERLGQSIEEMRGACEYVQRQKSRFVVAVSAPTTFAMYWLLPRLVAFHADNPTVSIWTATRQTGENPNLSASDIVITRGAVPHPDSRLHPMEPLFEEQLTVISSPKLLRRIPVRRPNDVLRHPLISAATRPGQWEAWLGAVELQHQLLEGGSRFDHLFVAMHAVRDGLGSIIAPLNLLGVSISKKEFAVPLPKMVIKGPAYIVYRTPRAEGRHVGLFTDWLYREAAQSGFRN